MLNALIGQDNLIQHNWAVEASDDVLVKRILFDETHGDLLGNQDTTELRGLLSLLPGIMVVEPNDAGSDESTIGNGLLDRCSIDILVIAAPTIPFSSEEIGAIENFLSEGKSLLFASNYDSLIHSQVTQQINDIMKSFGLQVQRLVGHSESNIQSFLPHYLSSGVNRLTIEDSVCIKVLNGNPLAIATFSELEKPFLAAAEIESSRVIVIGDVSFLKNGIIHQDDNQKLALNIFRWLASKNFVDIQNVEVDSEIRYGKQGRFSLDLINSCLKERLEGVQCLLESDAIAQISKPQISMSSIAVKGRVEQNWQVEPQRLGAQSLSLTVELPEERGGTAFRITPAAQFRCIPDADIKLVIDNHKGDVQEVVETGTPFMVSASVRWESGARQTPLHFSLESPSPSVIVEHLADSHWRLTALSDGKWAIAMRLEETGQKITRLIYAEPSPSSKIDKVEREVVSELASKIKYRLSQVLPEFDVAAIQQIPFKLLTPEDYIGKVYPSHMKEYLLEALRTVRLKREGFDQLVDDLLFYVAPMYSPNYGCCIPYDPELATYLIERYPAYKENIAYNFVWAENRPDYGRAWLEGNIAALLLHEKYGHGFFYTQTRLGQQLSILYRHGLLRKVDTDALKAPYLRVMHKEFGQVIRMLAHSALLLNEGFATWIELVGLQHLGGAFEETVYRRKEFLFQDTALEKLCDRSEYFKQFDPRPGSKYELGFIWLESIQSHFGVELGLRSTLEAVIKAANVDFGISESDGRVQFALSANQIRHLLLDDQKGLEAGAQLRLGRICHTLDEYFDEFEPLQSFQDRQHEALSGKASVNAILEKELGW